MNEITINKEIEKILKKNSITNKKDVYKKILSFIDLTTLEGKDTNKKVEELSDKAISYKKNNPLLENVAAVCVYPTLVNVAANRLKEKGVSIAAVAGAFPSGQSPLEIRLQEVKYAIDEGADEIDMVISRGKFLEGNYEFIAEEVKQHKEVCGDVHLKVILETGELESLENVYQASKISISAGADFIKTSTGKIQPAATLEASYVMLQAIKECYEESGKMIGFKAAGGISEPEDAIKYYALVESVLGEKWLNKNLFRIGASRLADKIFSELS